MKKSFKIIEPVSFLPGSSRSQPRRSSQAKWVIRGSLGILVLFLAYSVWFVFSAQQLLVQILPEPEHISIKGGLLKLRFGEYYLVRPGNYVLKASQKGYHPVVLPFTVSTKKGQKLSLAMQKLPGRLTVTAHQVDTPSSSIEGATVYLDGKEIGVTPVSQVEVQPGTRPLRIRAKNYQDFTAQLEIEGMEKSQSFTFALVPGWALIKIDSVPSGAQVLMGDMQKGVTPLSLKLAAGSYELKIMAERYKTWQTRLDVQANQPQALDPIKLQPADGVLGLRTKPSGADVTVEGTYLGQTPIDISLTADRDHLVHISKAGHDKIERTITVVSASFRELNLKLVPRKSTIHFEVQPADAVLYVNGALRGTVPKKISLIAVEHRLEIRKDGYEPYRTKITPRPGFPQELSVTLKKKLSAKGASAEIIKAVNGYTLKLISPAAFTAGSSRREQGRRSNETLRKVILKRPFYMGIREVNNKEFRQFLTNHHSGFFKGHSLNREEHPVVQVTWQQAALFCNWLSEKEKLPPVYRKQSDKLVPKNPLPAGYRLPTETEWEYCARFANNTASLRYTWGDTFPPKPGTLNVADLSAKDLLSRYLEKYNDGHPVTAPVASYTANALGLFDLGGNAAEWCHDYYSIYTSSADSAGIDPTGPKQGKLYVIKGSSWQHASISTLRSAYRGYANDKRNDLGFRICRYAK